MAENTWGEIGRVARLHRCETVLVGLPRLTAPGVESKLETLIEQLDCDVVVLRAPRRWHISAVKRVLVPTGGRGDHSHLRARLLASLSRSSELEVTFLRLVPSGTTAERRRRAERELAALARDEVLVSHQVLIEESNDMTTAILRHADEADLIILGTQRAKGRKVLGDLPLRVARDSDLPLVLISRSRAG